MSEHNVSIAVTSLGWRGYCRYCGWLGPERSIKHAAGGDGEDHLIEAAGAPPIVVAREATWSPYP